MTEKALEAYNDVFADIVNNLLFNGREKVKRDCIVDLFYQKVYSVLWNHTNCTWTGG